MKHFLIMLTAAGVLAVSCEKDNLGQNDGSNHASVLLNPGVNDFLDRMEDSLRIDPAIAGDMYNLEGIRYENNKLIVSVGYAGGCEAHSFEVQGKVRPEYIYPPNADLTIIHRSNGDNCEAYVTEDIEIDLDDLLGSDSVNLRIFNPSQLETRYASLPYRHLQQGRGCPVATTFEEVVCGTGVYDNKWFRVSGEELYLQPVSLGFSVDDTGLTTGESYQVGFWESKWMGSDSVAVCLAWPGPSVFAEIVCLDEE